MAMDVHMWLMKCKGRMHEIVKDEVEKSGESLKWKETLETTFSRMDKEIVDVSFNSTMRCGWINRGRNGVAIPQHLTIRIEETGGHLIFRNGA
nr:protein phosphatase 2C 37-like [Tanacetum cinerariifolium]